MSAGIVGIAARRVDTPQEATGRTRFITDVAVPRMAHAKLWRSPLTHARIRTVDATRAARAPGVARCPKRAR